MLGQIGRTLGCLGLAVLSTPIALYGAGETQMLGVTAFAVALLILAISLVSTDLRSWTRLPTLASARAPRRMYTINDFRPR